MRFAHTNIICKNWKQLVDFYINTFQCKLVPPVRHQSGQWLDKGTGLVEAHLEGAHLLLPGHGPTGPTLEIYQYAAIKDQGAIPPNKRGFAHIAFEVESVSETLALIQKNGGTANGEVTVRKVPGVGRLTFVYARDPESNLIELQAWD